ncbi:MAG: hypothetical protein GY789_18615 [Hyphomicrobiales bacterium]|nr:hypothetical protein [Hyphomicrobiales bacterium]
MSATAARIRNPFRRQVSHAEVFELLAALIVAGIGAFANAEGIIRVTKKEGVSEVYSFDINCN